MKLAFCLFRYFPFGGLQRDFLRIAAECVRRGHTVDVYTMRWEGEFDPQLAIHVLPPQGWQNHTRIKNFITQVQQACATKQYDAVIGFNKMPGLDIYYAADTCFQAKARHQHGAWYRLLPRYRHLAAYEAAVFDQTAKTKILLISAAQQPEFMHFYHTAKERFYLLPPGIARDRVAPSNAAEVRAAMRSELQIQADDFLLLLVGSGFKTKGLDRILLGMAALPPTLKNRAKLCVVGKDNPQIFLRQAEKLGIAQQVTFLGGRSDVPRLLLAADLLLHPAYNENTGTVLLEALVSGLPVLTTDVCGYAHYVQTADAGMVLPSPFQQAQFNQTLADMLLSPRRQTWQQNGLVFAKQADIYSMPEHAVNIIEHR